MKKLSKEEIARRIEVAKKDRAYYRDLLMQRTKAPSGNGISITTGPSMAGVENLYRQKMVDAEKRIEELDDLLEGRIS